MDGQAKATGDTGNLFLDHLSRATRDRLLTHFSRVTLTAAEAVYQPGERIERILFPIGSVVSVVTEMLNGSGVEVGFIGRDGMTGVPVVLGMGIAQQRALVQIPDSALSIGAEAFRRLLLGEADLSALARRYAYASMVSVSQFAACNRLHPVNERCARWLLMAHDRVPGDTLHLTHEFLAQMLGVRRAGVSVAASTLQQAGFIEYNHGVIAMRDRSGLEGAACECYATVEAEWLRIVGYSVGKGARAPHIEGDGVAHTH